MDPKTDTLTEETGAMIEDIDSNNVVEESKTRAGIPVPAELTEGKVCMKEEDEDQSQNSRQGKTDSSQDRMDNEEGEQKSGIDHQCLVCYSHVDTFSAENFKIPEEQFHDLLKVFQISNTSFERLSTTGLPPRLFCEECSKNVVGALDLLYQIECLQNDFKKMTEILRKNLLNHGVQESKSEPDAVSQVRKTLIQCMSSCSVVVKNPRKKRAAHGNTAVDDSFLQLLSPVTVISPGFRPMRRDSGKEESTSHGSSESDGGGHSGPNDSDVYESAEEDINKEDSDVAEEIPRRKGRPPKKRKAPPPKKAASKAKLPKRQTKEIKNTKVQPPGERTFDDEENLISFKCNRCQITLELEDYRSKNDEFSFQCSQPCCEKKMSCFANLVAHHEGFCPSKPPEEPVKRGRGRPRKYPQPVTTNVLSSSANNGFKYDDDGKSVIGFDCPRCQNSMSSTDYKTESGYVFKCTWESCDKATSTFANLCYHHQTHCSGKRRPKWKGQKKWKSSRQGTDPDGNPIEGSQTENGRVYDDKGRIVSFECPRCEKKMTYPDYIDEVTKAYTFKCSSTCCEKIFTTFPNLVFHHESRCSPIQSSIISVYSDTGSLESFLCNVCNENFAGTVPNSGEEDAVTAEVQYKCQIAECDQSFTVFMDFRSHHETHCGPKLNENGEMINPIYSIKRRKITSTGLMRHSLNQKKGKTFAFTCEICGKGYDQQVCFENHLKCHDGSLDFECKICDRKFSTQANLAKHARHHEIAKDQRCTKPEIMLEPSRKQFDPDGNLASYQCQHCDRMINKTECIRGTGEHENEYRCWLNCCDRNFIHFTAMVVHHVANCPMKKPSVCEICNKSFPTTWKMRLHFRESHTEQEPLYCDQCGKSFTKKVDLIRHMVTHSEDKPYACSLCPSRYKRGKNLKVHMRIHNGERPFMCSTCGKTFRSGGTLRDHEKMHVVQYLDCPFCNRMFKSQHDVDVHVARIHPTSEIIKADNSAVVPVPVEIPPEPREQRPIVEAPAQEAETGSYQVHDYSNRTVNNYPPFFPPGFHWK